MTFKVGLERPAVTFTIAASLQVTAVAETTVRCDRILTPQEAGCHPQIHCAMFQIFKEKGANKLDPVEN